MTSLVGTSSRRRAVVEGTFTRSMLAAAARGLGLVGAAVLLGVVLLQVTDDTGGPSPGSQTVGAGSDETTTTTSTPADLDTGLRPPGQVQVLVLNAARISGAAGDVTADLEAIGHPTLTPGNAPTQEETVIFYKPGFEREAEAVAPEVSDVAITEPLPDPSPFAGAEDADVVVVLGTSFAGGGGGGADASG